MESYPEDLLVGVFPLVFAVNAILEPPPPATADEQSADQPPSRTDFDRFLDAVAGSLADESDEAEDNNVNLEFQPIIPVDTVSGSRNSSLFRPDDYDLGGDSTDDDLLLDDTEGSISSPGGFKRRSSTGTGALRLYGGFGMSRRSMNAGGVGSSHSTSNTSYAKALQHGQGFFQRARIVSCATDHTFPKSKDPDGTNTIVSALTKARTSVQKAKEVFTDRPIQGIIPAKWLEKHVYALPSVVLVIVKYSSTNQAQQDARLLRTVKHLHGSLASKRSCKIHIVTLVDDNIAANKAQQWGLDISRQIVESSPITSQPDSHQMTLLRSGKDLRSGTDGFPTSVALKRLHRSVRDSSLAYYLDLTRRTKDKLASLSNGEKKRAAGAARQRPQPPKELLPLAIRYCFKIAIYYEIQLKFEKSLLFMSEAYRYAKTYYHQLVRLSAKGFDLSDDEDERMFLDAGQESKPISAGSLTTGEVEVEASSTVVSSRWISGIPPPPSDMAHQCIAVADWLNFKLLQAGFGSHTEAGLLAADGQWRQHARVFCARRFLGGHPIMSEEWYFWSYVARQRLVMSQLVERHPPKALGDLGNEYDEVLLRCAPWRAYEASAEALLKVGVYVRKAQAKKETSVTSGESNDNSPAVYVGGLDKAGLVPLLEAQEKINHKDEALELVLRAISLFEHELAKERQKDADDQLLNRASGRFGARLHYLAGGILVGTKKYGEATVHLEKAAKYGSGWNGIESSVRRLLAECYLNSQTPIPSGTEGGAGESSSLAVEACFYSKMSPANLFRTLKHCSDTSGAGPIHWRCESLNEFDDSIPFSFSATFPKRSHATTGDTVSANVWLRSNLDYAVAIKSIFFLRMAGKNEIAVPLSDFVAGSADTFVVVPPREVLTFSTTIELPRSLDEISLDEDSGNDKHNKASSVKSARPRTAGITSAAGARLISEELFKKNPRNSNASGWSLDFLGGKVVRCDSIRLVLSAIESENETSKDVAGAPPIELTIEKIKRKLPANLKRTPFEEDNYVASAWCRPLHMQLPSGPRCLRALGPKSDMRISNVSQSVTKGKAVEGTVNRVCLKLEAGSEERCSDIKFTITCTSAVEGSDGTTTGLTASESPEDGMIYMKSPDVRAPVLVASSPREAPMQAEGYGFDLPNGWELCGSGQEMEGGVLKTSSLEPGDTTYICFQMYRAADIAVGGMAGVNQASQGTGICQTDFEVVVSYRQEKIRMQTASADEPNNDTQVPRVSDDVSQQFSGSMLWTKPLLATHDVSAKSAMPCGSQHASNLVDVARPVDSYVLSKDFPLFDGERVNIRSILKANTSVDEFAFEIKSIDIENEGVQESKNDLEDHVTLYRAQDADPTRWLKKQSKFCLVYSVQAKLADENQSANRPLGAVSLEWLPIGIELPDEVKSSLGPEGTHDHGPLVLSSPTSTKFCGPMSHVVKAPFKVGFHCVPCVPRVSVPFEVKYSITNDTSYHQRLSVVLDSKEEQGSKPEILTCGFLTGDLRLAPHETKILSYTAIATKPGTMSLPSAYITSTRYSTWVVNEGLQNQRQVCIIP